MSKQSDQSARNINLPNALTVLRLLALPFCAYALFKDGGSNDFWRIIAWIGFFLVGLTDLMDGKLARSRNQVTSFGTFLDPVADKAAIGTALIGLSIQGRLWWWVSIVILFREVAVTLLRLAVIRGGVIPASKGGKLKTMMQGFGIGFYILPLPSWLNIPRDTFMAATIAITLVTGADYFIKVFKNAS